MFLSRGDRDLGDNESIHDFEEELEDKQYLYSKFYFAKGILDNRSNAEDYELIYTKC